jgi:stress responsive alpha/beta barrel protein
MIQRVVAIKLKDPYSNPEDRAKVAAASREVLGAVPEVRSIEVGTPADFAAEKSWDVLLLLRFDDLDAVEVYRAHENHRRYLDVFLRPMLAVIKVWNFELAS